jgi:hypothetical protein
MACRSAFAWYRLRHISKLFIRQRWDAQGMLHNEMEASSVLRLAHPTVWCCCAWYAHDTDARAATTWNAAVAILFLYATGLAGQTDSLALLIGNFGLCALCLAACLSVALGDELFGDDSVSPGRHGIEDPCILKRSEGRVWRWKLDSEGKCWSACFTTNSCDTGSQAQPPSTIVIASRAIQLCLF